MRSQNQPAWGSSDLVGFRWSQRRSSRTQCESVGCRRVEELHDEVPPLRIIAPRLLDAGLRRLYVVASQNRMRIPSIPLEQVDRTRYRRHQGRALALPRLSADACSRFSPLSQFLILPFPHTPFWPAPRGSPEPACLRSTPTCAKLRRNPKTRVSPKVARLRTSRLAKEPQ